MFQPHAQCARRCVVVLLAALCLGVADRASAQSRFTGVGRVVEIDAVKKTITLDHEAIDGLMPAMVMEFAIHEPSLLSRATVGTVVRFTLESRERRWIVVSAEPAMAGTPPPTVSFPAPAFSLRTVAGQNINLADLRGKVVLINFWATWCPPCRAELAMFETLYQRYKDRGLEIVAVNVDGTSKATVEAFIMQLRPTFHIPLDDSGATARAYQVVGLPTTYIVDRAGNIIVREIGERNWLDTTAVAALDALLSDRSNKVQ